MTKAPAKGEQTLRERVLEATVLEFGEKGYQGARMEEIAAIAKASKQALYLHFKARKNCSSKR